MNDEYTQVEQGVDYAAIIDQEQTRQQERQVSGELVHVAYIKDLAPYANWSGEISAAGNEALSAEELSIYNQLVQDAVKPTQEGGQVACMDGRGLEDDIQLGPKTAAGTLGNAYRLMLASKADASGDLSFDESLVRVQDIDAKYGFNSGTHAPTQCGAQRFSSYAINAIARDPEQTKSSVQTFMEAVGYTYNEAAMDAIIGAASELAPQVGETIVETNEVATKLTSANPQSCPELARGHVEKAIVVFPDTDVSLDNNALIAGAQQKLGKELQAFGYNWGYHLAVAEELGGTLGDTYLHSVVSQDIPVLTQLTDGSLPILAFKKD